MIKNQNEQTKKENLLTIKESCWIDLLLENGGNEKEFKEICKNSRNLLFALCKYKKILRQRGNGQVSFIEIKNSYNNKNIEKLHNLLNKLFLEYYTRDEVDNFLDLMNKTDTSIEDVYNKHLENPENILFSTLTL